MQIFIAKNGEKTGPFSEAQVREMLAAGSASATDLAWHEGMADWKPLGQVLPAQPGPVAPAGPVSPVAPATVAGRPVLDPNLAGRGARLGAFLIDLLFFALCVGPGAAMAGLSDQGDTVYSIGVVLCVVGFLIAVVVQIMLLTKRGQTVGKKLVGVKIVKYDDGSAPGFVHACLLRAIVPGIIGNVPIVGPLFSLTDICCIFTYERRCLHDLIAKTKVVNA